MAHTINLETEPQLSKELLPKQIKEGEVKTFKLVGAGAIDPLSGLPSHKAGGTYVGTTTVFDKVKKKKVFLRNITGIGSTIKDGKDVIEEVISDVVFDSIGLLHVTWDQPETYVYLSRHNVCLTNPYRDKNVKAEWEELLPINAEEQVKFRLDLEYESMRLVKEADINQIKAMVVTLAKKGYLKHVNIDGHASDTRHELVKFTRTNPAEIIRASKNKKEVTKLDIVEANDLREIEYSYDNNEWIWCNIHGTEKLIHTVEPGSDAVNSLAEFLLKEEEANGNKKPEERKPTILKKIKDSLKGLSVGA